MEGIHEHIENNNSTPWYQSAYREIRFETALGKIVDKILWSLEPNETFVLICMDLSALFNIVDLE